nr:hypothetical protein GCM10020241_12820 [Streptoalloteichus tenebrarius]
MWEGVLSRRTGTTWAQRERDAARVYRSQGFGSLPAKITTPRERLGCDWFSVLAEDGRPVRAEVREQAPLRPLYQEFHDWTRKVGMPWLANDAQPSYPANPSTEVPRAGTRPRVDGVGGQDEYPGEPVTLTHWQGERCASDQDCSARARLSRDGDDLFVFVEVADDRRGAVLPAEDCKRHWRTDSVEVAIDPRGRADDTSTTFKAAFLPVTAEGGPCAARDADQHQGPAGQTAPGLEFASAPLAGSPAGYTIEARIPLGALPAGVDPERFAVNILVYDSDTDDRTGKTRLAWSPFGSAQADPYVWGVARLVDYTPPPGQPTEPIPPVIPTEAARSSDSPASLAQSRRTGVPLAVGPRIRH